MMLSPERETNGYQTDLGTLGSKSMQGKITPGQVVDHKRVQLRSEVLLLALLECNAGAFQGDATETRTMA
jgi:hypothetical protein